MEPRGTVSQPRSFRCGLVELGQRHTGREDLERRTLWLSPKHHHKCPRRGRRGRVDTDRGAGQVAPGGAGVGLWPQGTPANPQPPDGWAGESPGAS